MPDFMAMFRRKKPKTVEPPSLHELVKRAEKKFSDAGLVRGNILVGDTTEHGQYLEWNGISFTYWWPSGNHPFNLAEHPNMDAIAALPRLFEKLVKDTAEHKARLVGTKASLEEFLDE